MDKSGLSSSVPPKEKKADGLEIKKKEIKNFTKQNKIKPWSSNNISKSIENSLREQEIKEKLYQLAEREDDDDGSCRGPLHGDSPPE